MKNYEGWATYFRDLDLDLQGQKVKFGTIGFTENCMKQKLQEIKSYVIWAVLKSDLDLYHQGQKAKLGTIGFTQKFKKPKLSRSENQDSKERSNIS